jgi:hypothetical protein
MRDLAIRSNRLTCAAAAPARPTLLGKMIIMTFTSEAGRTRAS